MFLLHNIKNGVKIILQCLKRNNEVYNRLYQLYIPIYNRLIEKALLGLFIK